MLADDTRFTIFFVQLNLVLVNFLGSNTLFINKIVIYARNEFSGYKEGSLLPNCSLSRCSIMPDSTATQFLVA